jgi:hypothetical protein
MDKFIIKTVTTAVATGTPLLDFFFRESDQPGPSGLESKAE